MGDNGDKKLDLAGWLLILFCVALILGQLTTLAEPVIF